MNYRCLNGNVLVSQLNEQVTTKAGLKVTATEVRGKKDIVSGVIILSSQDKILTQGNVVYYPMFAGQPISVEGQDLFVVNAKDIVLVRKDD